MNIIISFIFIEILFLIIGFILFFILNGIKSDNKFYRFLFRQMASFIAPIHFKPKNCPYYKSRKCSIWNCKYHFFDNKYVDYCTKECD